MRRIQLLRVLSLIFLFLFAAPFSQAESDQKKVFGEGLSDAEKISISEIVKDPDAHVGKRVQVSGKVAGVCQMMGCWMDIQAPSGEKIQIKVDDGVIVFPADAVGKNAVAEGVVEILEMTREEYAGWLKHMAEENGLSFDAGQIGEPPYRIVRLRGKGAEID